MADFIHRKSHPIICQLEARVIEGGIFSCGTIKMMTKEMCNMIKGLYEAHLPVRNLEVSMKFYEKLGLSFAWRDEETAFFWIEKGKSWLGLWQGDEYQTPYHPSLRHIAFEVSYEDLKKSLEWLESIQVPAVPFGRRTSVEPFVRPHQGNASVYFNDPDGNSLEFMCYIPVPDEAKHITDKLSLEEWEKLVNGGGSQG